MRLEMRVVVKVVLTLGTVLSAATASALPRFAVRKGAACRMCHINPTGGGMRNEFGRNVFEQHELSADLLPDNMQTAMRFDPTLGDSFSLGADLRIAFMYQGLTAVQQQQPIESPTLLVRLPTRSTFFPMQFDLYSAAFLGRYMTLYADIGVLGSFELFALLHGLPLAGYVKAGMFVPPYGTRLANHSASIRQPIGFDPRAKDAGVEIGLEPGPVRVTFSLQNGELTGTPIDQAQGVLLAARIDATIELGPLVLNPGGSFLHIEAASSETDEFGQPFVDTDTRGGVFLWASLGRFTYLGEVDVRFVTQKPAVDPRTGTAKREAVLVQYHELNFWVAKGFELQLTWETMDPDLDIAEPEPNVLGRLSVGAQIFPLPFTEIQLLYRHYFARAGRVENRLDEFLALVHLYF